MATIKLVRRLANPRRVRRANPRKRRLKSRRRNPALVLTLGAVNPKPKRRKNSMARSYRRRKNARRRRTARKAMVFPLIRVKANRRRRRRNPVVIRTRRRYARRRRNPVFSPGNWTVVGGGLVGVAATRFLGQVIPLGMLGFAGGMAPLLRDAIAAFVVSWGGNAVVGSGSESKAKFRDGITFGALMQVASTAISAFVPSLRQYGFGISGMGYMMPAQFPVPQNPLALPPAPAPQARVTANGLSRAFGTAF
jgi:hypothetical protein